MMPARIPAAVVEVGDATASICGSRRSARLDYEDESPPTQKDTIFDLASLTKVIATTSLMMRLVEQGRLSLDGRVASGFPNGAATIAST